MGAYYYLIASLPEIKSGEQKINYNFIQIAGDILSQLSGGDAHLFKYFLYQNDNKNLVRKIAKSKGLFSPYKDFIAPSVFTEEEIEKYENTSNMPNYMILFLENSKGKDFANAREIENTILNLYYEEMLSLSNVFLKNYATYMRDLKNVLTALNARALGFSSEALSSELIGDYPLTNAITKSQAADFGIGKEVPYINSIIEAFNSSDVSDPYNIENLESSLVSEYLETATALKNFQSENLFAYFIKLSYAALRSTRDEESGKNYILSLVDSVKNNIK